MARIRRYLGRVEVWLDKKEKAALRHAVDVLAEGRPGAAPRPTGRLTPRAYEDPGLEAEYQRFAAPEVTTMVTADVDVVRSDLAGKTEPLRMDDTHALTWLRALNHLRLVAGERLGIEDDGWEESAVEGHAGDECWAILLDLGWVQEGILAALG